MQHPGAVELNCPDTDAQTMGYRLVLLALNQAVENLPLARGKLRYLVSCLADAQLGWPSKADSPAFDGGEKAAGKFALKKLKPLGRSLPRFPLGLQCLRGVHQLARSHVDYEFETMLDHLAVGDVANDAEQ